MSFPGGIQYTNSGFLLSSKTLIGKQVVFTRLAVGDGELGGQSPLELTGLIHEVESIEINKLQTIDATHAVVGGPFTNQGLAQGFWWRELGLYAEDPDTQEEKLYCYGNAGALADYIPAGGGAEILEKQTDIIILVAATANVSAVINSSLIYASAQNLTEHVGDGAAHGATALATALTMMLRDVDGRVQVQDPVGDLDVVNMRSVDTLVSAAAILAKLIGEDGAGSGLDADKLDGQHASEFALTSHTHEIDSIPGLRDQLNAIYYSTIQQNMSASSVAWAMAQLFLPGALPENTYTFTDVFSSDVASEALVLDPVGLEVARTRPEGIHRYIAKKAGVTVSNFDSCADLAASAAACNGILASTNAMDAVVSMSTAYTPFIASATAMNLFAQNATMLTKLFANYTIREAMFDGASAFAALQTYARAWMVANVQVTSSDSVASASKTWNGLNIAKVIGLELTVAGTATKRHATWKTPECADIGDGSLTNQFAKLTAFDFSYWSSGTSYTATATAKYVQMCP